MSRIHIHTIPQNEVAFAWVGVSYYITFLSLLHFMKQRGGNALIAASYEGRTDVFSILLEAGADKEAKDEVVEAFTVNIQKLPKFSLSSPQPKFDSFVF